MPSNSNTKLFRSKKDRIIAGVCGGLGEYFNVDPVLVRVVFILLAFANGFGLLLYVVLMIVIPSGPETEETGTLSGQAEAERPETKATTFSAPQEPRIVAAVQPMLESPDSSPAGLIKSKRGLIGAVVIIIGLVILLDNFLPIFDWISWKMVWALAIIFLGYLIVKN